MKSQAVLSVRSRESVRLAYREDVVVTAPRCGDHQEADQERRIVTAAVPYRGPELGHRVAGGTGRSMASSVIAMATTASGKNELDAHSALPGSFLLEHARHYGQVLMTESGVNRLLPFVSQAGKDGKPVAGGCLQREVHVLERE